MQMIYRVEIWNGRADLNCYIESSKPITEKHIKKFLLAENPDLRRNASLQIVFEAIKPVNERYFWTKV